MIDVRKICVMGAGNVGVSCAVELSQKKETEVWLLTSKAKTLSSSFSLVDIDTNEKKVSDSIFVTDDYKTALTDTDLCIITQPSFLIESVMAEVSKYNPKIILFTPGYGDKHKYCGELIKKDCIISGFDRSPFICRLIDSNNVSASKKTQIRVGAVNCPNIDELAILYTKLFRFNVIGLSNYLTVNFTPSNPILHTARLYSMFKDVEKDYKFSRMIKFYAEWTDNSSEVMLTMDDELQKLCRVIEAKDGIDLSQVIPLTVHYESPTVKAMTNKITSIKSFRNIDAPMIQNGDGYYIDWNSRYFREDFPYGLLILKKYAQDYSVDTPMMDIVIDWFNNITG